MKKIKGRERGEEEERDGGEGKREVGMREDTRD